MKYITSKIKGFTLIETMVAISVLMFAILGPLSIASSSLVNARIARDQVTAFYLAQEGLEFVRYVRDTNYLSNPSSTDSGKWVENLDDCASGSGCQIDVTSYFNSGSFGGVDGEISSCNIAGCDVLRVHNDTGLYTYSTNDSSATSFVRTITVSSISVNEIQVVSQVSWQTGTIKKDIELVGNLRNIYGYEE